MNPEYPSSLLRDITTPLKINNEFDDFHLIFSVWWPLGAGANSGSPSLRFRIQGSVVSQLGLKAKGKSFMSNYINFIGRVPIEEGKFEYYARTQSGSFYKLGNFQGIYYY
jgi:hypothetical protein